jgi:hypothetical protein
MAQTADDPSTWSLIFDERAFVTALCNGSEKVADEVLRDALEHGSIAWHCWKLEADLSGVPPQLHAKLVGMRKIFWHRGANIRPPDIPRFRD